MPDRLCRAGGLALFLALAGCAASVVSTPVDFISATGNVVTLQHNAEIELATGYKRRLDGGSRWQKVGTVPQGDVFRPVGTVFTIEGRNIHEAQLVISPVRQLVGFYLPGEATYSPLPKAMPISFSN